MDLGRGPAGPVPFFDDVDRAYVVAQLEGAMDAPVNLGVSVRRSSGLLLPGASADGGDAEAGRQAERLGKELAALEPRIRLRVTDAGCDLPVFTVGSRGGGGVRFVGQPRVNLFRALLETIRRASTGDHGLDDDAASRLRRLPRPVAARVFATPT